MLKLYILSLLLSSLGVLGDQLYTIKNSCPSTATLYINGVAEGSLAASGGIIQKNLTDNFDGFIYTDVNGGGQNGTGTRAGFYGDDKYYYIVIDPEHFNAVATIIPLDQLPSDGFCVPATCASANCTTAFQSPPIGFPPPGTTAPASPAYACPQNTRGYQVEFCPGGTLPQVPGQELHPNGNPGKCLEVRGAVYSNGTPVQIYDCNGTGAQKWQIARGQTKVRVVNTNFCLDAGNAPANGVGLKIWTCYDNLAAQSWYYTEDNRIALTNAGLCTDLTDGDLTNANQVQTWQCTDNNVNQIWTTAFTMPFSTT